MTIYATGNALGSTDVRDVLDNAQNFDDAVNDTASDTWVDRFGRTRKTLKGYGTQFDAGQASREAAFQQFLEGTGWSSLGAYTAGVSITSHTQTVDYQGQPYSLKPSIPASLDAPYVVTGNWATESVNFKLVGDNSLRQDLAAPTGASLLGTIRRDIDKAESSLDRVIQGLRVNIWEDQFSSLVTSKPSADPGTWDWTPAFEAASLYVKSKGGGVVELTSGTFSFTRIFRRNGVSVECRGSSATYLQALPFSPGDGRPYGLVEQEPGPVIASHFKGAHLLGNAANPEQWGMYLHAQWDPTFTHGGLWLSAQDDVRITFFNKGLWSRGGYTIAHYLRPQQFLDMKSTYIQVPTGGEALRLTGQHGQILFTLGSAEGRDGQTAARCVMMGFDPDPSTTAVNNSGHGESTSDVSGVGNAVQKPINVAFGDKFSIQKARQGLYFQGASNISVYGAWVENIGQFLTAVNGAYVDVDRCHLAKAADGTLLGAAGTGYLFSCGSASAVIVREANEVVGTTDSATDPAMSLNNNSGLDIRLSQFGDATGKFKVSAGRSSTISAVGLVAMLGHRYSTVAPNADPSIPLRTLTASAGPNQEITLRAGVAPFTLGNGGNISLNGLSAVTVPPFGVCILKRLFEVGSGGEWALVSVTEHFASGVPTSGYYAQGTKVWRSNPGAGSFMGTVCTTSGIAGTTAVFKNMAALAV